MNSRRKWLSPPSAWIGSMMIAAMSSLRSANARSISATACRSTSATRAISASSAGNRSAGLMTRGQSNFAKY